MYDDNVRQIFSTISKQIALENQYEPEELAGDPQYLLARIEKLRGETANLAKQFDDEEFRIVRSALQ